MRAINRRIHRIEDMGYSGLLISVVGSATNNCEKCRAVTASKVVPCATRCKDQSPTLQSVVDESPDSHDDCP